MNSLMAFSTSGIILGITAGIAPGPLVTLLISETLRHNVKAGIKVAFSPLITDGSIILLTTLLLTRISSFKSILGIISIIGGFYIIYLGYENLSIKKVNLDTKTTKPQSLKKGILTNLLSPHPYMFWATVGAPTIIKGMNSNIFFGTSFILTFFIGIIGTKSLLAVLIDRYKSFVDNKWYFYIMKILGIILIIFACLLIKDGLELMKLI